MTSSRVLLTAAALLAAALVAPGCAKKPAATTPPEAAVPAPAEAPAPTPPPAKAPEAEPFPAQPVETAPVVEPTIDELNRQGILRTVHFAYNSNALDDEARTILQGNATWIKGHAGYTVEISGHCDERGSIGYNVALGDRRATAVKDYVVSLGASGAKLTTVSYGEEKPVDPGHNEAAWAKNRRAEFLIKP